MTNPCTCKAEHWQPHADACPAKVQRPILTLENIRSGAVPSDAHAVGFLLGEIERLQTEWNNASDLGNALLTEAVRLRAEVRALRIGDGFADPDSLDAPAHEPVAVASFPALSIDPAADEVVDRLVADRLSKKSRTQQESTEPVAPREYVCDCAPKQVQVCAAQEEITGRRPKYCRAELKSSERQCMYSKNGQHDFNSMHQCVFCGDLESALRTNDGR